MVAVSYFIHIRLYHKMKYIITKWHSCFIRNCDNGLLQKYDRLFLSQNATFYYKMQQLLENAMFITICGGSPQYLRKKHLKNL